MTSTMNSLGAFTQIDTRMVRSKDRFDFWRGAHPQVHLDLLDCDKADQFSGRLDYCIGADGMMFGHELSDNFIARFAQPQGDFLMLSAAASGGAHVEVPHAGNLNTLAGSELLAMDISRPITVTTQAFEQLILMVPLPLLRNDLYSDRWPPRDGVAWLPKQRLTPFLQTQMQLLAQTGPMMTPAEAQSAMSALKALVLGMLEQADPGEITKAEGLPDDSVHVAAQQYIALNFWRADLSAEQIAMAIGCSRAKLYRIFEERGETLGTVIRGKRLRHAKHILLDDPQLPIKLIAHHCGYRSVEAFTRAFRSQFDVTPGEYRLIAVRA